jgi:hypothetical protein
VYCLAPCNLFAGLDRSRSLSLSRPNLGRLCTVQLHSVTERAERSVISRSSTVYITNLKPQYNVWMPRVLFNFVSHLLQIMHESRFSTFSSRHPRTRLKVLDNIYFLLDIQYKSSSRRLPV